MMRFLAAPLLALIVVATADAQAPPAFTERDRAAAITALAGAVTAGTARDEISTPRTVKGFLTPDKSTIYVELLAAAFRQAGVSRHLIVLGGHRVENGVIDYRLPAQTEIFLGVSEFRNGRWQMTSKGAPLTSTGFNGRDPVAALRKIGSDRHALELQSNLWNQGNSLSLVDLYDLRGTQPAELLRVVTDADDCGFSDSCFAFAGALRIDPKPGALAYEATLELSGTYRNDTGGFAGIPGNAPFVLRLVNGTYTPLLTTPARRALWSALQSPWER